MSEVLSSYWRPRPSTPLPLDSASYLAAHSASGNYVTVTGDKPTLSSLITGPGIATTVPAPTAVTSISNVITPTSVPTSLVAYTPTDSSLIINTVSATPTATSSTVNNSDVIAQAQDHLTETNSRPHLAIILCIFGALLLIIFLCFMLQRCRRKTAKRDRTDCESLASEVGQQGNGVVNGGDGNGNGSEKRPWSTVGAAPENVWDRIKEYENIVKDRESNRTGIPSLPPSAITRQEAALTVPTFHHEPVHDHTRDSRFDMLSDTATVKTDMLLATPRPEAPEPDTDPSPSSSNIRVLCGPGVNRPRLVAREERPVQNYRRNTVDSDLEIETNIHDKITLVEMFAHELQAEVDDEEKRRVADALYVKKRAAESFAALRALSPATDSVHALTHSLGSYSSREKINTSAYPFNVPPPPALSPVPSLDPNPFVDPTETTDEGITDSPSTGIGKSMLASTKRKPVPMAENELLAVEVPSSSLLTPDFVAATSTSTADSEVKRKTYRSPTESIYGCYQADDERQPSFVDFSVSPKKIT